MADLMGGRGPATSNGNGAPPVRATIGRSAVGSPSGIRGPKAIMQQRAEREARQREERERERERQQREHLEKEARLQEEAERREAERRAAEKAPDMRRVPAAGADLAHKNVGHPY
ncbi:hypothetical protein NUW58_g10830 [Xylaria curta]|uniref:Uncharacterized protein n=1 Tax=Xylaria curta TaxID=42375 RepID=A0ACC1MGF7_9PEZI|nr:hypothetical protein NUW58_g10830 [Xylaria curta]